MLSYFTRRLTESFLVLAVMSLVIYTLIGLMPGDPIDIMVFSDPEMTPADAERLRAAYGLDRPLFERYLTWLGSALSGDFGYSRLYNQPTMDILLPRLGNTVVLMGLSFILALAIALPAGIYAATRPQSPVDHAINLVAFAGISVPPFWLAILLIILFAVTFPLLPAGGMGDGRDFWDDARHLVLPVLALTIATVGGIVRFMRAAAIETLRQDFVRTARAKGLTGRQIVVGHVLRNAMIPVVTILALQMGNLFSGALITEQIFAYLGMGKTIYDSVIGNDYNVALAGLLLATLTTLLANLLADLAYGWLDPRISYQ